MYLLNNLKVIIIKPIIKVEFILLVNKTCLLHFLIVIKGIEFNDRNGFDGKINKSKYNIKPIHLLVIKFLLK